MVIAAAETNAMDRFSYACDFFFWIFGGGVLRWGNGYLTKVTMANRLILMALYVSAILHVITNSKYVSGDGTMLHQKITDFVLRWAVTVKICFTVINIAHGMFQHRKIVAHLDHENRVDGDFKNLGITITNRSWILIEFVGFIMLFLPHVIIVAVVEQVEGNARRQVLFYVFRLYPSLLNAILYMKSVIPLHAIYQKFKEINENFRAVPSIPHSEQIHKIRKLRVLHRDTISLARNLMDIQALYLLQCISTAFFYTCFNLYRIYEDLILGSTHGDSYVTASVMYIFMDVAELTLLCYICRRASSEGNETREILVDTIMDEPRHVANMEISFILSYLKRERVTFSPWRLFNINNRLLTSLCGITITHFIILIQFSESDQPSGPSTNSF